MSSVCSAVDNKDAGRREPPCTSPSYRDSTYLCSKETLTEQNPKWRRVIRFWISPNIIKGDGIVGYGTDQKNNGANTQSSEMVLNCRAYW
ncbi:hypothetical protein B566_EDAN001568 [Ephemera danica]|nr:hypothetical protein B566_EDAN001568 [Ephemera danica]